MADTWAPFLAGLSYLESNQNPNAGNSTSTAKGAFQFLNGTAAEARNKYGINNTQSGSYDDQAKATQQYIRAINPNAAAALDRGDYQSAITGLRGTWPSLPGGSQPQNKSRYDKFQSILGQPVDTSAMAQNDIGPNTLALLQQNRAQQGAETQPYSFSGSDWSNPLIQAGAALMASSNPRGAAALAGISQGNQRNLNEQRQLQQNNLQTITLPNGDVVQVDKSSGRIINTGINGAPLEHVTRTNFLGDTEIGSFDKKTGKVNWDTDDTATSVQDAVQKIQDAKANLDPNLTPEQRREALLKLAPPVLKDYTKAYIEGKVSPGGSMGVGGKINKATSILAHTIDEDTDDNTFAQRRTLYNDFAHSNPASLGGQAASMGAVAQHGTEIKSAFDALYKDHPNFLGKNIIAVNAATNKFEAQTGDPDVARITNLLNIYADEKAKYFSGRPATVDERHTIANTLNAGNSPRQVNAILAGDARAILDKKDEYVQKWKAITHNGPLPVDGDIISKKGQQSLETLKGLDTELQKTQQGVTDLSKYMTK